MKLAQQRVKPRRHARVLPIAAIAAAALALPAAGHAAAITVGSDLTKQADLVEAHGADALFFNTLIDGAPGAMPTDGQVTLVRVKGSVLDSPSLRRNPHAPDPQFHFQVIHPIGGGRFKVMLSSAPFRLPVVTVARDGSLQGNPQALNSYSPVNLCVRKGDYVDFNDIGGSEWSWGALNGMHVQAFSRTPSSTIGFYTRSNGTNINSVWAPQAYQQGEELLMQARLSTGPDATDFCPGGFKQHVFTGLGVKGGTVSLSTSKGTVKLRGSCPNPTYGACKGVLLIKGKINGSDVSLGGAPFVVKRGWSSSFEIKLSKQNVDLIKKAGGVKAQVTADGHDDPAHDSRAKPGIAVQKKITAATVTIRPG
jgi:hypothetical protein